MLDQDTSYRITRCYYIQGIHNGDFLGDEENIEAHHGDDEGYNIIRIIINEVGAILNIVLWESIRSELLIKDKASSTEAIQLAIKMTIKMQ